MKHIHGLTASYALPMHWLLQKSGSGDSQTTQKPSQWWQKNKGWKSTKLFSLLLKFTKTLSLFLSREDIPKQLKRQLCNFQSLTLHGTIWKKSEWSDSNSENAPISWTWLWKTSNYHHSCWLLPPDVCTSFLYAYSCTCHISLQNWILKESINLKYWVSCCQVP